MRIPVFAAGLLLGVSGLFAAPTNEVASAIEGDLNRLVALYKDLHRNPELSLLEKETSRRFAAELREAGFTVTEHVGGTGVVGVLRNGDGPVVLLRCDMDALPVAEQTGLPYASTRRQVNTSGEEAPVMHACGHDMHMSVVLGTSRLLGAHTNLFRGTVVVIGQPAEERGAGARAMLKDGLFERFPKPNYCLALHVSPMLRAGMVAYVPGYILANVDTVDVTIRGVGGHGAYPHTTKDPIVLAAETVLALQTLISREKPATEPAVLTVGSIHGGTKHNIIPDDVKLQLTVRSYSESVRLNLLEGIRRVTRGLAEAAGVPEDRMPIVKVQEDEYTPAAYNDPGLTRRIASTLEHWLGPDSVRQEEPQMGGEDFGMYGRTQDKIPVCMLWLGSVSADRLAAGTTPPIHSALYFPEIEKTLKTGITVLSAATLDLLKP